MASREELQELRALALKRQRAVSQKISRNKAKGLDLAGSKHDPRKAPANINRYTAAQLHDHLAKLDYFTSRKVQFTKGAKDKIIPKHGIYGWNRVEQLQNALNKEKAKRLDEIKDIFIPSSGMTIGERVEAVTPKHPVTAPPSSYAPHVPFTRKSSGVPNEKQLVKLVKDMEGKQGENYFQKKYESQHKAARKMVAGIRNKALSREFKDLNPTEFNILWNYTNFSDVTALDYVIRKKMFHDKKELAWYDIALDTQLKEAKERIQEIKGLKLGGRE